MLKKKEFQQCLKENIKKPSFTILVFLMLSSLLIAVVITSKNFKIPIVTLSTGGGKAEIGIYKLTGTLGDMMAGISVGEFYRAKTGFMAQFTTVKGVLPATNLDEVFVYPSPYKPGTGGEFDADYITFKNLTTEVTIKVFNIAGELVATLEKDDTAVNYYEWSAQNDAGEKIATGVYIYFITNPDGDTPARGKFAIIK